YQTKVESASKYRMRLSGIVLLNLFSNVGTVDNADIPSIAYDRPPGGSGGSFGGSLRQSEIGLEVFGPQLAGAHTKADLQLDLGGGFPRALNGVNFGLLRLRTGTMRMAWSRTLFGQPLRVGVGGYYGRQSYGFNRNVDGWAGMTDWDLPLGRQFSLSGKFYRGRALGGLGGGVGRSVFFSGDPGSI